MSTSSNVEYSALKKRAGLHNWAFMPSRLEWEEELDLDFNELSEEDIFSTEEVLQQNDHGEYYALQNLEE